MIVDKIENASQYYALGEKIAAALKYLETQDLSQVESGKYPIMGDEVFALVQEYESKPMDQGFWEVHRKYIDVQYIVRGLEQIGYAKLKSSRASEEYDDAKDYQVLEGDGDFLRLSSGMFAILWPWDAHMPGMAVYTPLSVKKVVVKVSV